MRHKLTSCYFKLIFKERRTSQERSRALYKRRTGGMEAGVEGVVQMSLV